jgi:uncharacterized protein YoxC
LDPQLFINAFIAVALILLAVSTFLLVSSAMPLMHQANRTAIAFEKLADTLQAETKPTLQELRDVISGVNQLRSVTAERVTEVGHRVEDVAGTVGQVAGSAKKHTAVWGAGLLAGVRAYLAGKDSTGSQAEVKQITDRGEKNV